MNSPDAPALSFDMPYPPSLNHIWRRVKNRTVLSRDARAYRKSVADCLFQARAPGAPLHAETLPLAGRLSAHFVLVPPDNIRRDLDNCLKAALDALTHAGIWGDDAQVDDLRITRAPRDRSRPRLEARLSTLVPP